MQLQKWKEQLKQADIDTPTLDVRVLVQHVTGLSHSDLIVGAEISEDHRAEIDKLIERRVAGEPVSKIIGVKEFYGRDFITTRDTLDPRSDTETLVQQALKFAKENYGPHPTTFPLPMGEGNEASALADSEVGEGLRILDLGTGTGCIILTLLAELPNATGVAADLSPAALEVAHRNAELLNLDSRVTFIESDWFENVEGQFDIIVSNPPYIPESNIESLQKEVRIYDPILALRGGKDGLDPYKNIFSHYKSYLKPGGRLLCEIGCWQDEDITRLIEESESRLVGITHDIAGIPRVVEISTGEK